jgi:hypothetical protein
MIQISVKTLNTSNTAHNLLIYDNIANYMFFK